MSKSIYTNITSNPNYKYLHNKNANTAFYTPYGATVGNKDLYHCKTIKVKGKSGEEIVKELAQLNKIPLAIFKRCVKPVVLEKCVVFSQYTTVWGRNHTIGFGKYDHYYPSISK